jgi:hypothetical protein
VNGPTTSGFPAFAISACAREKAIQLNYIPIPESWLLSGFPNEKKTKSE